MRKKIEITPNLETLFGTRDENLHLLEDGLRVSIDMRSDCVGIEGPAENVLADPALHALGVAEPSPVRLRRMAREAGIGAAIIERALVGVSQDVGDA